MNTLKFLIPTVKEVQAQEWLRTWAALYPEDYLEDKYRELIKRNKSFSADDFGEIGKWKDNVKTDKQWKPNVGSVAYPIWMTAAQERPQCPENNDAENFLENWSGKAYTDVFPKKSVNKHFGLPRASTLLHFVSGGRYPIFDSRVRTAIARLRNSRRPPNTVRWYMDSFCPLFLEIADLCGTAHDLRTLDKALFSYGAAAKRLFSN